MTGLGWNKYLLRDGCRRKAAAETVRNICDPTVIDQEQGTLLYHEKNIFLAREHASCLLLMVWARSSCRVQAPTTWPASYLAEIRGGACSACKIAEECFRLGRLCARMCDDAACAQPLCFTKRYNALVGAVYSHKRRAPALAHTRLFA